MSLSSQSEPRPTLESPFYNRAGIVDRRYFFGRADETRKTFEIMRHGQCVSVVGPRRIGKTSLLFHLCDLEVQKEHQLGVDFLVVYIDGQSLGDLNKKGLYQWLWQETKGELVRRGNTDGWGGSITDFGRFRDAMVAVHERGYKLAFLFDEFDTIAQNSNIDQDFFSQLRSLVPPLIYVTASMGNLYDLTCADGSVLSSPFFNHFTEVPLGFLSSKQSEEMVLGLLRMAEQDELFTKDDLDFVFKIGGYHPFFVQLACDHLFKYKVEHKESVADYANVLQQYEDSAQSHFRHIWRNLDTEEQEAVRLVCKGKARQLSPDQKRLLERGCIIYNNVLFSSIFAEFVQRSSVGNRKPTQLCILHLSDLHFGTREEAAKYRMQLETDLVHNLAVEQLDYLIITGDIANRSVPAEYEAAFDLVDKLSERFELAPSQIVVVPGNHDVNWDISKKAFRRFVQGDELPSPQSEERYIREGTGALERDEKLYRKRFAYFNSCFYRMLYDQDYPLNYAKQAILTLNRNHKILFLGLNSAWQVDHHYRRRASVNMAALDYAFDQLVKGDFDDWLKIAVWHHPVSGPEMMNDGFLQLLATWGFQICMHGHIHEAQRGFYTYDSTRALHIVGAGTFGSRPDGQTPGIPLQYNLLRLDMRNHAVTVETRKKERADGAWSADARWGDMNRPRPYYKFKLRRGRRKVKV